MTLIRLRIAIVFSLGVRGPVGSSVSDALRTLSGLPEDAERDRGCLVSAPRLEASYTLGAYSEQGHRERVTHG